MTAMAMGDQPVHHISSCREDDISNVAINCMGNKEFLIKDTAVQDFSIVMLSDSMNVLKNDKVIDDSRLRDLDEEIVGESLAFSKSLDEGSFNNELMVFKSGGSASFLEWCIGNSWEEPNVV